MYSPCIFLVFCKFDYHENDLIMLISVQITGVVWCSISTKVKRQFLFSDASYHIGNWQQCKEVIFRFSLVSKPSWRIYTMDLSSGRRPIDYNCFTVFYHTLWVCLLLLFTYSFWWRKHGRWLMGEEFGLVMFWNIRRGNFLVDMSAKWKQD